jgi:hypothetical protein
MINKRGVVDLVESVSPVCPRNLDYSNSGSAPDPVPHADYNNPQSLNLYAYVVDNPLGLTDTDGHGCLDNQATLTSDVSISTGGGDETKSVFASMSVSGDCNPAPVPLTQVQSNTQINPQKTTPSPAPNNTKPWYQNSCVTDALKTGAINAGIDSIGFIPEAGGIARMIGHGSGYRGVVADQLGHKVITAVGKTTETVNSAAGASGSDWTSWVSGVITVGDFIPVVNEFTTVAALSWDTGVGAYKVYQCPK